MSYNVRRVLAIVFVIIIAFGWVVTVKGIGPISPIKDRMGLGLDIKGGVYVVLEADAKDLAKYSNEDDKRTVMEQTQAVIENRVNELGLSEPTVTIEGENRIRVELPGAENAEELRASFGLGEKFTMLTDNLRAVLANDEDTVGIEVKQRGDETARRIVEAWVKEYADIR